MALNENARNLIRYCPEIVNDLADRLVAEFGLFTQVKLTEPPGTIRTPEDLWRPLETRED